PAATDVYSLSLHDALPIWEAGDRALSRLTEKVSKPIITTLHTVLRRPDPIQRDSTRLLVKRSAHTVVISRAARQMLVDHYRVDPDRKSTRLNSSHVKISYA